MRELALIRPLSDAYNGGRVMLVIIVNIVLILLIGELDLQAKQYTWTGGGDGQLWSDAKNWNLNEVPGEGALEDGPPSVSIARLGGGPANVTLTKTVSLLTLQVGEGVYLYGGHLILEAGGTWTGGLINTRITISAPAKFIITGHSQKELNGTGRRFGRTLMPTLINNGTLVLTGTGRLFLTWEPRIVNNGAITLIGQTRIQGFRCCTRPTSEVLNNGSLNVEGESSLADTALITKGPINVVNNAILTLEGGGGSFLSRWSEGERRWGDGNG